MMMPDEKSHVKMFGYMEKRGKMTIRGRWKRKWCVLEGHLLLYYKSQTEYLKLSPCCGCLNVALVRKIQPNVGYLIYITTHSQVIVLRTENKLKQEEWFHALVSVLPQNNHEGLLYNDSLFPTMSSHRKSEKRKKTKPNEYSGKNRNYCSKNLTVIEEVDDYSSKYDCKQTRNCGTENVHMIGTKQNVLNDFPNLKCIPRWSSDGNIKDLSKNINFKKFRKSFSFDCILTSLSRIHIDSIKLFNDQYSDKKIRNQTKLKDLKNNELLQVENSEECSTQTIPKKRSKIAVAHRHSLGFLKQILLRRKTRRLQKPQIKSQDLRNSDDTTAMTLETPNDGIKSEFKEISYTLESGDTDNKAIPGKISDSAAKTNVTIKEEKSQMCSMMQCDKISANEALPELPTKTKINSQKYNLEKGRMNFDSERADRCSTFNPNIELDKLMSQLTDLNKEPDFSHTSIQTKENAVSDYDIPRSHLSIISEIISHQINTENSGSNCFDNKCYHSSSFEMAPDSLEMPWLSDDKVNNNYWPATSEHHLHLKTNIESDDDDFFLDSLDTVKHLS